MIKYEFLIIMVLYQLCLIFVGPGAPVILGDTSAQAKAEEGLKKFNAGPSKIFPKENLDTMPFTFILCPC